MSAFQQNLPHREQVNLFPAEEQDALAALLDGFPEAVDLAQTHPALAVAHARGWDTFGLVTPDRAFVGDMLGQRRRRIGGALGFPANERVVRILGKVQPQACAVTPLARSRGALRNPAILSILSHLPTIGPTELRVAAEFRGELTFRDDAPLDRLRHRHRSLQRHQPAFRSSIFRACANCASLFRSVVPPRGTSGARP
jgi:hypothetical protein